MFGLQVNTPGHGILKLHLGRCQLLDRVRVTDATKSLLTETSDLLGCHIFIVLSVEAQLLRATTYDLAEEEAQKFLRQLHVILKVCKGHLRFDHPELSQMASGVGILSPEGRAESVNVA